MPLKQLKVTLTDRQLGYLRQESKRTGISLSEVLRRLLDRILDQEQQERRKRGGRK